MVEQDTGQPLVQPLEGRTDTTSGNASTGRSARRPANRRRQNGEATHA